MGVFPYFIIIIMWSSLNIYLQTYDKIWAPKERDQFLSIPKKQLQSYIDVIYPTY